ncbi:MAG: hypothetical protein WBC37_11815 [Burkholderiaceae bacterium]
MNAVSCRRMHRARRLAAIGLLGACVTTAAAAADFRGFVSDGPAGLLVFQPCVGASLGRQVFKVSDKSRNTALTAGASAVRQVMEDASRPLYVEFAGEASGDSLIVRRFHRAIGHIVACASAPKDIAPATVLQASGADPSWRFIATANGAQLELASGKTVRFPADPFKPTKAASTQVFDAWSSRDGGTVRVEITEEMCLEERTETASGARVALRYASTSVEGCAARF